MRNLVPNLVYATRGDEVDYVVVNGQVIVEHGRVLSIDAEATLTDAQRLADSIGSKAEPEFWRLNTLNAQLMRSDRPTLSRHSHLEEVTIGTAKVHAALAAQHVLCLSVGRVLGIVAEVDASLSQPIHNCRELCGADGKRHMVTWSRWLANEQDGAAVVEAHVEHVLVGPVRQRCRKPQNLRKPPRRGLRIRRRQREMIDGYRHVAQHSGLRS
jgi:hypothetical protein